MNRLDKVVVFHPLKRQELDEVLEIELRQVQKRLDCATRPFQFRITNEGGSSCCKRAPTRDMEHAT
jgi:ATP-dependent Clp protease ATP-binding subunit ClpA